MRLTLRQLHIFLAVAQSGSTTAACDVVALSQSATSAALNELERLLNCKLFDRIGKRLILNDSGRLLLPLARQILDAATSIEQQFAIADESNRGNLYIGASTTIGVYLLPSILATSVVAADTELQPRVMIANTADVTAAVARFEVDIGLIEGPCHEPGMHVEPWMRDELIIVAAPNHPIIDGKVNRKVSLKALRETGWLLREPGSGTREAVEHALVPHLHYLRSNGEFSNSETIKYAAAEGLGVACLSRCIVDDLIAIGRLVELETTLPKLSRNFYIIYSEQKNLSARLNNFLHLSRTWRQ